MGADDAIRTLNHLTDLNNSAQLDVANWMEKESNRTRTADEMEERDRNIHFAVKTGKALAAFQDLLVDLI
jgi:hypothetical protein